MKNQGCLFSNNLIKPANRIKKKVIDWNIKVIDSNMQDKRSRESSPRLKVLKED